MTPDLKRSLLTRDNRTSLTIQREVTPGLVSEFPSFVGCVYGNPTVPTNTNLFVSVNPADVFGSEVEGGSGSLTIDGSRTILVFLVGSKPVLQGDFVICRFLGNRWVGERLGRSSPGIALPGCPCTSLPTTITMTSSKPSSNNLMFQNATFVYGATPTSLAALNLGSNCYLSTKQFTDYSTNDQFWYYFGCYLGYYIITRVYAKSQYGTPYRDQVRYRWLAGSAGNTCSPLLLAKGTMYMGGDTSCIVTISA